MVAGTALHAAHQQKPITSSLMFSATCGLNVSVNEWFLLQLHFWKKKTKTESPVVCCHSDVALSFHGHLKGNLGSAHLVNEVIKELTTCY